jgi:hypothetical protein
MDENGEGFVTIWLQSEAQHFAADEKLAIENLQQHFLSIKVFDDVHACVDYILSLFDELIFLRLGYGWSFLVPLLNGINQIKCIYLSERSEYGSDPKVRGVFTSIDELYVQWSKDIRLFENDLTHLTCCENRASRLETSTRDFGKEAKRILWSPTLLKLLIAMPPPNQDFYEHALNEVRRLYHHNPAIIKQIDEFQREYKPDDAVHWYTRDSFVYRMINKALRTQNIIIIFKFRSLISDIYYQLKKLQDEQGPPLRKSFEIYPFF